MKRILLLSLLVGAVCTGGCTPPHDPINEAAKTDAKAGQAGPDLREVEAIARDGFIYGLPLVMNYAVVNDYFINPDSGQFKAPFNQIHNEHKVFTYKDTSVVTPNSDTPYSLACLDLRAEAYVLSVPKVDKNRYYSVQVVDWNTFNVGYVGTRATGFDAGSYLLAGPDWKGETPAGIKKVINSTTQFVLLVFRTQLLNAEDMANVEKVQAGYQVQPLSAWRKEPAPPAAAPLEWPKIDKAMVKENFFEYLDFVLQLAPPGPEETEIRARLARIGVGPGKSFAFRDLSAEHKAAVALGMKAGEKQVDEKATTLGTAVNHWNISSAFGNREFYKGDWLLRAGAAKAGIYGNNSDEATYPLTRVDSQDQPLDGSKHKYTLTFPAGQLPPVNAFWSVTMYDGKTQFLIKNPINRYLINSPMLPSLKKGADGSVTLYIQKDAPPGDKAANWLPAPDGPIYLAMRLYWPKTEPPSILPAGHGTWSPPAVTTAD